MNVVNENQQKFDYSCLGALNLKEILEEFFHLVFVAVIVVIVGGVVFLASWDIPAPVAGVEKVIPDERFPR